MRLGDEFLCNFAYVTGLDEQGDGRTPYILAPKTTLHNMMRMLRTYFKPLPHPPALPHPLALSNSTGGRSGPIGLTIL